MEIVKPSVRLIDNADGAATAAYAARVCTMSSGTNDAKTLEICKRDGHLSVFRHWTHYYVIPHGDYTDIASFAIERLDTADVFFGQHPYVHVRYIPNFVYLVLANHQFVIEHPTFEKFFSKHEVTREKFASFDEGRDILRWTFEVVTSIEISRELNRVSPNNICEQSTRYVNFIGKTGNVAICEFAGGEDLTEEQKEFLYNSFDESANKYNMAINEKKIPVEHARHLLPLETATKVVYTYTAEEWKHIIDLRYYEKTGKAAPGAKLIAGMIKEILCEKGYKI